MISYLIMKKAIALIFTTVFLGALVFGQNAALTKAKDFEHQGDQAYGQGQINDAFVSYRQSLKILKENHAGNKDILNEYVDCLIKVSTRAYESGLKDTAVAHLEDALKVGAANYDHKEPRLGRIYYKRADVYLAKGDYNTALDYYEKSFKVFHKKQHEYPADMAHVIYKKAYILNHYKHEMDKAYKACVQAIDLGVEDSNDNPELGDYFSECGLIEFVRGNYNDSYDFFLNALSIKENQLGHDHEKVGIAYEEFAAVNFELHRYDSAMYFFNEARDIYDKVYDHPESHIEVVNYNDQALAYLELDADTSQHHNSMKKELDLSFITLTKNDKKVAEAYMHIAEVYEHQENYELAISSYKAAIDVFQEVYVHNNAEVAMAYDHLGKVYEKNGNPEKAKEAYTEYARILEEVLGADDLLTRKAKAKASGSKAISGN